MKRDLRRDTCCLPLENYHFNEDQQLSQLQFIWRKNKIRTGKNILKFCKFYMAEALIKQFMEDLHLIGWTVQFVVKPFRTQDNLPVDTFSASPAWQNGTNPKLLQSVPYAENPST